MNLKNKLDIISIHANTFKHVVRELDSTSTVSVILTVKSDIFEKEIDSISGYMKKWICDGIKEDFDGSKTVYMLAEGVSILIEEEK